MRHDVFVSYARQDRPRVARLVDALVQAGKTVFWDREIPPGKNWENSIGAALEAARCVIVVWTHQSLASDWVHEEANEGKRRGVLLPVRLDDVVPPLGFRSVQAADLFTSEFRAGDPVFDRLLGAIDELVARNAGSQRPAGLPHLTGSDTPLEPSVSSSPAGTTGSPERAASTVQSAGDVASMQRRPPWWKRKVPLLGAAIAAIALVVAVGYLVVSPSPPLTPVPPPPSSVRDALATYKYNFWWSGGPQIGQTVSPLTMVRFAEDGRAVLHYARPGTIVASLEQTSLRGTWKDGDGEGELELKFTPDFSRAEGWWRYRDQDQKYPATMQRLQ